MTNTNEFVTREEFITAIDDLNRRVQGLYNLADRMGYSVTVPERASVPESVSDADAPSVTPAQTTTTTGTGSGVDYPAVAYGLSDLRSKIASQLGSSAEVNRVYADAVDWFASCFAGDSSFDESAFRAAAGV